MTLASIVFPDGSVITSTPVGYQYAGIVANEIGHIVRRYNLTIEQVADMHPEIIRVTTIRI